MTLVHCHRIQRKHAEILSIAETACAFRLLNMLLTGGDPIRDLLQWLDQGDAYSSKWAYLCSHGPYRPDRLSPG